MQREDIARLYDANYAASYEEKFLFSNLTKSDSDDRAGAEGEPWSSHHGKRFS